MTDLLGADTEIRVSLTLFVGFGKVFVIYNIIQGFNIRFLEGIINLSHLQIVKKSLHMILIY